MNNYLNIKKITDSILRKKSYLYTIILLGLIIKIMLFPFILGDYIVYFEPWVNFIKNNGYFDSLKYNFCGYPPLYTYILIIIAKTGFYPLYLIKIVSILFEYLLAYYVGKIAYMHNKNELTVLIAFTFVPLIPTIMLNGAFWGQFDSIYSAFVIGSIYYILKNKSFLSILFLGLAFTLKLQSVFILPFYFVLLLRGKVKWYYFGLIPIVYFITIIPTWLYGRTLFDLFSIYFHQTNYFEMLTVFLPNIYVLISNDYYEIGKVIGSLFTIFICLFFGIYLSSKKFNFSFETWVKLGFLSVVLIPFILPGMHERYLYLGDAMATLYFLTFRKNIHLTIGMIFVSFYAYVSCSRLKDILPLWPAFIVYSFFIILIIKDFAKSLSVSSAKIHK